MLTLEALQGLRLEKLAGFRDLDNLGTATGHDLAAADSWNRAVRLAQWSRFSDEKGTDTSGPPTVGLLMASLNVEQFGLLENC
jgi:hypothetical protein